MPHSFVRVGFLVTPGYQIQTQDDLWGCFEIFFNCRQIVSPEFSLNDLIGKCALETGPFLYVFCLQRELTAIFFFSSSWYFVNGLKRQFLVNPKQSHFSHSKPNQHSQFLFNSSKNEKKKKT